MWNKIKHLLSYLDIAIAFMLFCFAIKGHFTGDDLAWYGNMIFAYIIIHNRVAESRMEMYYASLKLDIINMHLEALKVPTMLKDALEKSQEKKNAIKR